MENGRGFIEIERYNKVRDALCSLVGASDINELHAMRTLLETYADTNKEAQAALDAIQVLLDTFPRDPAPAFNPCMPQGDYIHNWFELTYAQYLTIPRSLLQSMPDDWQKRFVDCLTEFDATFDWRPEHGRYWVRLKDECGKYMHDPFMDYQRGRRRITSVECKNLMKGG